MSVGSPPKRRETCRRGLEKEERRGKEKRGGGRVIFIGVLLFILEFGAGLAFFFSSLVACFGLRCWDRVLCCQLKLDLYPADSRQWQRGTLGSPSAHWRSSVTGLDSKIRQEDGRGSRKRWLGCWI